MKCVLLMSVFLVLGQAASMHDVLDKEWAQFKVTHMKKYENKIVELARKQIFTEKYYFVKEHNKKYEQGLVSFRLAINRFSDLQKHEFVKLMNGLKIRTKTNNLIYQKSDNETLPDSIDWRNKGAVTPVKDQGQCGSCWAFSATGSLEGQHFRKTGKLVSLSEQNLIDCSGPCGNDGCDGGLMDQAFDYILNNEGIDTEESYPYEADDDECRFNRSSVGATLTSYVDIKNGSEDDLQSAVANLGPISVAIDASNESFQSYYDGIYDEQSCSSKYLDHGVLVVGYGTEHGKDYWLVKNSWGPEWGKNGYIKMSRNRNNQCGIATEASYPLV